MPRYISFPITNDYHVNNMIFLSGYEREFRFMYGKAWDRTLKGRNRYAHIIYEETSKPKKNISKILKQKPTIPISDLYDLTYTPAAYIIATLKEDEPYKNCIFICSLATHPNYRRRGLAKLLIKNLAADFRRPLLTTIPDTYTDVCKLFASLNFSVVDNFDFLGNQDFGEGYLFSLPNAGMICKA